MALIGDQIITDILGANQFGIDSILIGTGISKINDFESFKISMPNFVMAGLD
jgi:ribonucleotide monophosphatase NagD (HAD superfamily)